jgi:hypothetical protein
MLLVSGKTETMGSLQTAKHSETLVVIIYCQGFVIKS